MITTIKEFKKLNENNENLIELIFHLDSPYKWGKGWTASAEAHDILKMEAMSIINNLHFTPSESNFGVVEGKPKYPDKSNMYNAYMHPMEFVFKLKEYNQTDIELIKANVEDGISNLNEHFPISIKEIRLNNKGEYSTITENVDTEIPALPVDVYRNKRGGATNGITAQKDDLMLVFDGLNSPFKVDALEDDDYLVLQTKSSFRGKEYKYAVPKSILDSGKHSMFGGNFVYSSDARFPSDAPIKVHDRVE